jgi:hypothetical protein
MQEVIWSSEEIQTCSSLCVASLGLDFFVPFPEGRLRSICTNTVHINIMAIIVINEESLFSLFILTTPPCLLRGGCDDFAGGIGGEPCKIRRLRS